MQKPSLLLEEEHFFQLILVLRAPWLSQSKFFHFAPAKPDDSSVRAGRDRVSHLPGALSSLGYRCLGAAGTEVWDVGWVPSQLPAPSLLSLGPQICEH